MREDFMSSLGLVIEGGGMRGAYTAGVLDFLCKIKLEVDGVVGVSQEPPMPVTSYLSNLKEITVLMSFMREIQSL